METVLGFITFIGIFIAGYTVGIMQGGIKVNIAQPEKIIEKEPEKPVYNEVHLDGMDPQVRAYLEQNQGNVKF